MNIDEISNLPDPDFLKIDSYETILQENITKLQELDPSWTPLESDNRMPMIRMFTYKYYLQQKREQAKLKSLLYKYSRGDALTNIIFQMTGVMRKSGEYPIAPYIIELNQSLDVNYILKKGYRLTDNQGNMAELKSDVVFLPNITAASAIFELKEYCEQSNSKPELQLENIQYIKSAKIKDGEYFKGGSFKESDESLLKRAILNKFSYSTAGAEQAYLFYIYKSDARILDAKVSLAGPNTIKICFLPNNFHVADSVKENIELHLSNPEIKPLCDYIVVECCGEKKEVVKIKLENNSESVRNKIKNIFKENNFLIGQSISLSDIYRLVVRSTQERFEIMSPLVPIIVNENEVLRLEPDFE